MKIENPFSLPKCISLLIFISLVVVPIDSFPIFPIETAYRPVSILILLIPFFIYFLKKRFYYLAPFLFLFSFSAFIHSYLMTFLLFGQIGHLFKTFVTTSLFFVLTTSLFTLINDGFKKKDIFFDFLGKAAFASLLLMVLVALIQILMKLGLVSVSLSDFVTNLFAHNSTQRVQSVSGEPSQMVRSLVLMMALVYFLYFNSYKKILLFTGCVVLVLSGSTYGYLTVLLMLLAFVMLFKPIYFFNFRLMFLLFVFVMFFVFLRMDFLDEYANTKIDTVLSLISTMSIDVLNAILQRDGSIFQRVMNPVIGFLSAPYSFFMGVGLDGYRYVYPTIILEYFPYALHFETVGAVVSGDIYITPKSLYSKVFSELGVIPFCLMVLYYLWLFLSVKKRFKVIGLPHFLFVYILIAPINADSIIYFNYFFALIFLHVFVVKSGFVLERHL